ncbi:MAG TPA: DUF3185 family protein [Geothermobacteraceae bacterium]|nr:DUF3185 family protein [Geothermobacteraceae bacterium]
MATGTSQLIGCVLLIAGIALLIWSFNRYGSFGNKLSRAVDGCVDAKTIATLAVAASALCSA